MFRKISSYSFFLLITIVFATADAQAQANKASTKAAHSKTTKPLIKPGPVRICVYTDSGSMIIKLDALAPGQFCEIDKGRFL